MASELIGVVERGKEFWVTYAPRTEFGLDIGGSSEWNPDHFDVIRNSTFEIVLLDQELSTISAYPNIYRGLIDTAISDFVPGEHYTLIIKEGAGIDPARWISYQISVVAPLTERTRVTLERLEYLRNNQENVIFERLRRILTNSGENLLLDKFTYDPAGNITGLRVRHFDSKDNVEAATPDIEDSSLPEVGEIMTYRVTQSHDLPRNVRTLHLSAPDTEAADAPASRNTVSDQEYAPGNEGGWPEE